VEGPRNVIADTFSRLSRQDDTSAAVGKKAITKDSKLAYYSFSDDKKIFNCLINLPCLSSDKKQKQKKLNKNCKSNRSDSCKHHLSQTKKNRRPEIEKKRKHRWIVRWKTNTMHAVTSISLIAV
jgi:hypothetical protein